MSKELKSLYHALLHEISEQEKKTAATASEEAMRRAEEIVQDVEEDKSWQIPPEPKKPQIPAPQHEPVVVPPPVSHFTDEPSQNPAVRMRDRLDETALPKPDVERKPTQIFEARPKKTVKKKKRRKKAVNHSSGRGADMPTSTEKKTKTPHVPDELSQEVSGNFSASVQKKTEAAPSPRDEMVRSRAEMIREQLRRAAEEEARQAEQSKTVKAAETMTDDATEEKPVEKASAFKRFLNVFLDLDSEEEETEQDEIWGVPDEEDAWGEPETDTEEEEVVSFRKGETDRAQPSFQNLTDVPEQETRPSLLSHFRQKRKKAVREENDQDEESTPQETDWRTLVVPPTEKVKEPSESDDAFYADDLSHRQSDTDDTAVHTSAEELSDIVVPPMPPPATPKAPDPETPSIPEPETPEVPAPETPSVPVPSAPPLPVSGASERRKHSGRLRNLEIFEEKSDDQEEPADIPQDMYTESASGGFAAVLREALDESAEELAEMKAEPLPGKHDGSMKNHFLKRHWYFLAGILCFLFALVGLVTCVGWGIGKVRHFVGSATIRQGIEDVLYPIAVVDLPAFETSDELDAGGLLSAAMVDILMYDDLSVYPVNFDVISIPANDVLARAQRRFGTAFSTEFTTLYAAGETFYYDAASGCYNVPTAPVIFSYAPEVIKLQRNGDIYTASVRCVSDKASWQEHSVNFKSDSEKYIEVTLEKNGDSYRILCIERVE